MSSSTALELLATPKLQAKTDHIVSKSRRPRMDFVEVSDQLSCCRRTPRLSITQTKRTSRLLLIHLVDILRRKNHAFTSNRDRDPVLQMELLAEVYLLCRRTTGADECIQEYCAGLDCVEPPWARCVASIRHVVVACRHDTSIRCMGSNRAAMHMQPPQL